MNIKDYKKSIWTSQYFALLSKKEDHFKTICDFTSCRGFMSDKLHNTIVGKENKKYKYIEEDFNLKTGSIYIGVTFISLEMKNLFISHLKSLHSKEQLAKVMKTKLYSTQDKLTLVVEGSRHWKDCLWKMQLYTYYLRSMCHENMVYYYDTHLRLNHCNNEIVLLSKLKDAYEKYDVSSIHADTGPDAICIGTFNKHMTEYLGVTPCP